MSLSKKSKYFLYPSSLYFSTKPTYVTTILGTCIAICLWDRERKFGGINHYMLPFWNGEGLATPKYGNIAIEKLVKLMLAHGAKIKNIEAKIFGGKEVEPELDSFRIGLRNTEFAIKTLKDLDIPLLAKSVGGFQGRKICFDTGSGEVYMKYIKKRLS